MLDLSYLSLIELNQMLLKKELSFFELIKFILFYIEKCDKYYKAFITINYKNSLKMAKFIDDNKLIEKSNNILIGMPFGVKDNIMTKGILTTAASKMLYNFKSVYNATVIDKMYNKNMILIGKTNLDEFAMGSSTEKSYFNITRNAWDLTKVAGGSSGGSAVAVATGQLPLTLGSDTGGSIRQPAAFNGVVGMKPTYGLVSRFGLISFSSSMDQIGPITRTVEDNALALDLISGFDNKDSTSVNFKKKEKFTKNLYDNIKNLKIALPIEYFEKGIDIKIKNMILNIVKKLEKLGAKIEEVSLPFSKYGLAVYYIISSAEACSNLQRFDGIRYGYRTKKFNNIEDIYKNSRTEGFGEEVKRRIMLGAFSLNAGCYEEFYKKACKVRYLIKKDFENVFKKYDIIISPTTPTVAFDINSNIKDPLTMYMNDILTIPVNLAYLPSISIPIGFLNKLPVGLQIIGNYFKENIMYKLAYNIERITKFYKNKSFILKEEN